MVVTCRICPTFKYETSNVENAALTAFFVPVKRISFYTDSVNLKGLELIMFLKERKHGHLIEVVELSNLFDPYQTSLKGCCHYGEELQEAESYSKQELLFPSGETLPRCWIDPHYRDHELVR